METLVLFGRVPGSGPHRGKLGRDLGDDEAERLSAAMWADQVMLAEEWVSRAAGGETRHVSVCVADGTDDPLVAELAAVCQARVRVPSGADPGEQIRNAMVDELDAGAQRVLVLLEHACALPVHLVEEAFRAMAFHDAVMGPAFNGNAWGMGLERRAATGAAREQALMTAWLDKQPWETHGLLMSSLERAAKAGFHVHWLPFWMDVLDAADLPRLKTYLRYQELRGAPAGAAVRAALSHKPPPAVGTPRRRETRS